MFTMKILLFAILSVAITSSLKVTPHLKNNYIPFSFVVLSDLHIGEGIPVYHGEECYSTNYLRTAIKAINSLKQRYNIQFVFITGDITGSAERTEFIKAKELLDTLEIPYYPIMGNHDIWEYNAQMEAKEPHGDAMFSSTFHDCYNRRPSQFFNFKITYNNDSVYNPLYNITSNFQNFEVKIDNGMVFYGLDWNTRKHAMRGDKGCLPNAELYNFPGGTYQWLESRLKKLDFFDRQIVFLQHQGFRTMAIPPDWIFTFNRTEKEQFRNLLLKHRLLNNYFGVFAGHLHRWYNGTAFDEWNTFVQWETAACKGEWDDDLIHSGFTLASVENGRISNIQIFHGKSIEEKEYTFT